MDNVIDNIQTAGRIDREVIKAKLQNARRVLKAGLVAVVFTIAQPVFSNITTDEFSTPEERSDFVKAVYAIKENAPWHQVNFFMQKGNDVHVRFNDEHLTNIKALAVAGKDRMTLKSDQRFDYFLQILSHELVHNELYYMIGDIAALDCLSPVDYAFIIMSEEATALTIEQMVRRAVYGSEARNTTIMEINGAESRAEVYDAVENQIRAQNPGASEEQIQLATNRRFFEIMFSDPNYMVGDVPNTFNDSELYKEFGPNWRKNAFYNEQFKNYRQNSEALKQLVFEFATSQLPFELAPGQTFTHFNQKFDQALNFYHQNADHKGIPSILDWETYAQKNAPLFRSRGSATGFSEIDQETQNRLAYLLKTQYGVVLANASEQSME